MQDYLREIDLNPPIGGPINNPLDPRAGNDFCFLSDGQEIVLVQPMPFPTQPIRVLVSFDCGHQALLNLPPPPPGTGPQVHGLLVFDPATGGIGQRNVLRRECCHQRRGVKIWLDPMSPLPPTSQPIVVVVSAWAKEGGC